MVLLYIIISIVLFSLLFQILNNRILQKIFYVISVLFVLIVYFIFARYSYLPHFFYPNAEQKIRTTFYEKQQACKLDSKYKPLLNSILKGHVFLFTSDQYPKLKHPDIYNVYPAIASTDLDLYLMFDMSYYKDKIYLYFGITPMLTFYLPYYIATKTFLSDQLLVFLLTSVIFIFSILILKVFISHTRLQIPFYIKILSVFIVGFANYSLFLLTRPELYEVCVAGAAFFFIFVLFIIAKNEKLSYLNLFVIGLFSALAVGCRPNYVLCIPLIFSFIILSLIENKITKKEILIKIGVFLIPCVLYGAFLAFYNYIRFDSIFEFGFKYQLNKNYVNMNGIINYSVQFSEMFNNLMIYLFQKPEILDKFPFFSSVQIPKKECMVGSFFMFPLMFIIFYFVFVWKKYKKNIKNVFYFNNVFIILFLLFLIGLFVSSIIGIVQRYVFEYMYVLILLSLVSFYIYYSFTKHKKLVLSFFTVMFIWTIYINFSVVLCSNNAQLYAYTNPDFYNSVINFLK